VDHPTTDDSAAAGARTRLPWQDIFWKLSLPPDVHGALDWIAGAILLNVDRDTYDRIHREGPGDDAELELVATVTHEAVHFYQVLVTGYLHDYVRRLGMLVKRAYQDEWTRRGADAGSFDDFVRVVDAAAERASPAVQRGVLRLSAELTQADDGGLSVLAIVEAQATYLELRRRADCNAAGFLELLDLHHVTADNRTAYDLTSEAIGDEAAFALFPFLSFLALCSTDPVVSFRLMLKHLRRAQSDDDVDGEASVTMAELVESCCGYAWLGSPLVREPASMPTGPYDRALARLRELCAADPEFYLDTFFADPLDSLERWIQEVYPALVFEPFPEGQIPMQPSRPAPDGLEDAFSMMFAVVGRNLLEAAPPDAPDDEPERRAALAAMHKGSVDALWNLGTIAAAEGSLDAAYVWWLLAAADGDHAALHANAVLLAGRDHDEEAEEWFELAREARAGTMQRLVVRADQLVTYGLGVKRQDLDASDECLRRAAAAGYAEGAYFYGLRVVESDLTEGIHLLLEAATAHAEISPYAAAKLDELRQGLGARRYWALYAKAARRRLRKGPLVPHQP
jgi:hypothetical protein